DHEEEIDSAARCLDEGLDACVRAEIHILCTAGGDDFLLATERRLAVSRCRGLAPVVTEEDALACGHLGLGLAPGGLPLGDSAAPALVEEALIHLEPPPDVDLPLARDYARGRLRVVKNFGSRLIDQPKP